MALLSAAIFLDWHSNFYPPNMDLGMQEEKWIVTQLILKFFVVVEEVGTLVSLEGMAVWKGKGQNN